MTHDLKRMLEQSVLHDLECLSSLIIDIRLVQEYISFNKIDQDHENDWQVRNRENTEGIEALNSQMGEVLWMRHQQLLAVKSVLSTRLVSLSKRSPGYSLLNRDA